MYYFDISNLNGLNDLGRLCQEEFSMVETIPANTKNRLWINENTDAKLCTINYLAEPKAILQVQTWPPYNHKDDQIRAFLKHTKQLLGSEKIYRDYEHKLKPYKID